MIVGFKLLLLLLLIGIGGVLLDILLVFLFLFILVLIFGEKIFLLCMIILFNRGNLL